MTIKKRISFPCDKNNLNTSKSSTVTRAAITANIKLTRGKQLVEHEPLSLIPDPNNPRPGEKIDDNWIKENLKIGTPESKCYYDNKTSNYIIPEFHCLDNVSPEVEEDYNFLRDLAFSIRIDGLIEPIEIFLADKENDPDYFSHSDLEFGYVVLEGHQRRLAAIIAGVQTVTCIEITDETTLARLKVKHRKLRRQLSENNLRKGLTVSQNYLITKELLSTEDGKDISVKELSSIIGLNQDIAGVLKRLINHSDNYPPELFDAVIKNKISFKWLRLWIGKSSKEILDALSKIDNPDNQKTLSRVTKEKPRGRSGGAIKRNAIFKVSKEEDTISLKNFLLEKFPELNSIENTDSHFTHLELLLSKLIDLSKTPARSGSVLL